MKKWLLLIPVSLVAIACHNGPSNAMEHTANALPVSAVDPPPPTRLWEEDPDYQEDQSGGNPAPPSYDSLGRRLAPPRKVQPTEGTGKAHGKGVSDRPPINPKLMDSLDRAAARRNKYGDSLWVEVYRAAQGGDTTTITAQGDEGVKDSNSLPKQDTTQRVTQTTRPVWKDSAGYASIQSFNNQPDPLLNSLKQQAQKLRVYKEKRH